MLLWEAHGQAALPPGGPFLFLVSLNKTPFVPGNASVLELCLLPTPTPKHGPQAGPQDQSRVLEAERGPQEPLLAPASLSASHGSSSPPTFSEHIPSRRPHARAEDPHPRGRCLWLSALPALRWAVSSGGASRLDPGISSGLAPCSVPATCSCFCDLVPAPPSSRKALVPALSLRDFPVLRVHIIQSWLDC